MPCQFLHSSDKLLRVCSPTFVCDPSSFIVVMPTDNTYGKLLTRVLAQNSTEEQVNVLYSMTLWCDDIWKCIKWLNLSFPSSLLPLFVRVYFARDAGSCDQSLTTRKRCNEDPSMWLWPLGPSLHSRTSQAQGCQTLTGGVRNKG